MNTLQIEEKIRLLKELRKKRAFIESWEIANELCQDNADDPRSWREASYLASFQQEYPKAIEMISRAIDLRPEEPAFYFKRSIDNLHLQHYGAALEDSNMVLKLSEKWDSIYYVDTALFFKAEALFRLGDYKQAAEITIGLPEDTCYWIGDGVRTRDDLLADCKNRI